MAIAGIVVGAVGILWMLAIAAYIVVIAVTGGACDLSLLGRGPAGTERRHRDERRPLPDFTLRTDLRTGDCLTTTPASYDMSDTEPVGCEVPHDAEVVGLVPMSGPVSTSEDEYDPAVKDAWETAPCSPSRCCPDYFADGDI